MNYINKYSFCYVFILQTYLNVINKIMRDAKHLSISLEQRRNCT